MTFFDQLFDKLFPKDAQGKPQPIEVKESIKRNESERSAYFRWINERQYKVLWATFWQEYQIARPDTVNPLGLIRYQSPYANGFAFGSQDVFAHAPISHLIDLLKDKSLNLGYYLSNSERKITENQGHIYTVERYYLKPRFAEFNPEERFDQRYGNLHLEAVKIDNQPEYVKLMANVYADRFYTKSLDFEELVKILFEV